MTAADKHQLAIARATLRMHPMMLGVLGGMTREQAVEVVARLGRKV
jgi:hypothetical protein